MRYAVVLALVSCVAGGVAVGDDWEDCLRAFPAVEDQVEYWQAAVAPCTKAAEQGHAEAQAILGFMYRSGRGVQQDYAKAVEWYTKAAEQGEAPSQNDLGAMYYHGYGVPQDYAKAFEWWTKAAEQGHARAPLALGDLYANGLGVEQNNKMAYFWYYLAATLIEGPENRKQLAKRRDDLAKEMTPQDISEAQQMSAEWYEKFQRRQLEVCLRPVEAEDWQAAVVSCTKAAELEHAEAQFRLGTLYYMGWGVSRDIAKAFELYTKAAEQGHAYAQSNLAMMYYDGEGVPQNPAKAFEWYNKAAEQGYALAQNALGWMYENGYGVEQNNKMAYFWYNLVATLDDAPTELALEAFLQAERRKICADRRDARAEQMTPQEIAEAERMSAEWLEKLWARQKED